jgi:hypothetical protein
MGSYTSFNEVAECDRNDMLNYKDVNCRHIPEIMRVMKNSFDIPTAKLFKRQINDELARAHVSASVSSVKMCFEEQNGELYAGFRFSLAEGRNTEKFRNVVENYVDGQILDGFGESMFTGKAEDGKPFYFCFS